VVEGEGAQWIEQAGKGGSSAFGASSKRTSWEGWQAEYGTPHTTNPERAPAEIQLGH